MKYDCNHDCDALHEAYETGWEEGRAGAIEEFKRALINEGGVQAMEVLKIAETVDSKKECDTCLFQRHKEILEEHDAEVRKAVLAEVEKKIYELELNYEALYESLFGYARKEAAADVVADLLEWIQGGQKNDE